MKIERVNILKPVDITITAGRLAEIAEKSEGYTVTSAAGYELTNIRFRRRANGRRDKSTVEIDYNGRTGVFNSDAPLVILD